MFEYFEKFSAMSVKFAVKILIVFIIVSQCNDLHLHSRSQLLLKVVDILTFSFIVISQAILN